MGRRKSKFKFRPKIGKNISAATASSSAPPPPWIELPEDITANILKRLGAEVMMERAQKVCTTWRRVCHDPSMWRVIDLVKPEYRLLEQYNLMCRQGVHRSQGQLVDLSLRYFGDNELINYVADRSCHIKRLTLQDCNDVTGKGLVEAVKKLPHLEELHLIIMPSVEAEDIKNIGISCPMLKSFSFNERGSMQPQLLLLEPYLLDDDFTDDEFALAVAKSMPNLCHLSLFAYCIRNKGLEAILECCPHLESLDIRQCICLDLKQGALGKRCSEQIKHVKYPSDSTSDIDWIIDDRDYWGADPLYGSPFSEYDDNGFYDDYTNRFNHVSFFGNDVLGILDWQYI